MTLLHTLVPFDYSPLRKIPSDAKKPAIVACQLEELMRVRADVLRDGFIDMQALQTHPSPWSNYLREACIVDAPLVRAILRHMVAPASERCGMDRLAGRSSRRVTAAERRAGVLGQLARLDSAQRHAQNATEIMMDCAYETFIKR